MTMPSPLEVINSPEMFAAAFEKILVDDPNNPGGEIMVPFQWNQIQRKFNASRKGRDIVLKCRQVGMTTYGVGETFRRCITKTRSEMIMAHDDTTTSYLRRMMDRFWQNCKFGSIQPARSVDNAGLSVYSDFNSEVLIAKAGSTNVGHGTHLTGFWGSEVSRWPDPEKLVVGAMQAGNPDIVLESTANGAQGYFFNLCMECLDGNSVWKFHFFPWWEESRYQYPEAEWDNVGVSNEPFTEEEELLAKKHNLSREQIAWRRYKKKELKQFFDEQYAEDPITAFLVSGEGYFGDISGCYTAPFGAEWNPDHKYRAGLDFAQSMDWTDMVVIDVTTGQQVDYMHIHQMPWEDIRRESVRVYNKWRGTKCPKGHVTVGAHSKCPFPGCGETNLEILGLKRVTAEKNSLGKPNIEALRKEGMLVDEFQTDQNSKREILSALYEALHSGKLKLLNEPTIRQEMASFIAMQTPSGMWTAKAMKGAHDDAVMSAAMANYAITPQIFFGE